MKKTQSIVFALAVLLFSMTILVTGTQARADEAETLQRATDKAISQIYEEYGKTNFPKIKNVAIVPLRDDAEGYATSGLKSAVTKTSYNLFTRSDKEWDKLLAEIEWGVRREDVMDARTVQKFGKIKGVDAVMFGRVWDSSVNMWDIRGRTKISVHLAEVETGKILWSSGPVEGEAYLHWSDALTRFWRYPLVIIGLLVGLIIILVILRKIVRAIKHANRPL